MSLPACPCFREECKTLRFEECHEEARDLDCDSTFMKVPTQEKQHRVKCLLRRDNESPKLDIEDSAEEAEEKLTSTGGGRRRGGKQDEEGLFVVEAVAASRR